ncbi:hypothetical protein BEL05_17595 [Shewanella colwelliana]|uniref:Uncharacterized protein n=1 Tax=Shewanella colwelliana TaxID=23 RepID=A0A1E5IYW0_SHECO|nr:hypothetical protein BEL05_17595 [Shewanella colwelliana]
MYFLITMHSEPRFYDLTCQQVLPELDYIESLTKTFIQNGEVRTVKLSSTSFMSGENDWMVSCPREAIEQLRELGIHPFKTKNEAREFAKLNQLDSFRYLKI